MTKSLLNNNQKYAKMFNVTYVILQKYGSSLSLEVLLKIPSEISPGIPQKKIEKFLQKYHQHFCRYVWGNYFLQVSLQTFPKHVFLELLAEFLPKIYLDFFSENWGGILGCFFRNSPRFNPRHSFRICAKENFKKCFRNFVQKFLRKKI